MEIFKNMREFFFPSDMPEDRGSSAPNTAEMQQQQQQHTSSVSEEYSSSGREPGSNIVNIQATAQLQVVLVKPEVFTDAKAIADHLISRKTVVLNLETASPENRRRIIDFLVGVSYAISGSLKPVANLTYIITPYNVGFIGDDLAAELENNGVVI